MCQNRLWFWCACSEVTGQATEYPSKIALFIKTMEIVSFSVFKISYYLVQISLWYSQIKKTIFKDCKTVGFCQSYLLMLNSTKALGRIGFHTDDSMSPISLFLWNGTTCDLLRKSQLFATLFFFWSLMRHNFFPSPCLNDSKSPQKLSR